MEDLLMPYIVRPRRLLAVAAGALLAIAGLPAAAHAACAATPLSKPFLQFGDSADYSLLSNGHFEAGTGGWTLKNSRVVSGNEPYKLRSGSDTKSLAVDPTGVAVSPSFCVGLEHQTFRLFVRQTSGSWAQLAINLRFKDETGKVNEGTVYATGGSGIGKWMVTPPITLARNLPLWHVDQSMPVQIVLDPVDTGGAWGFDDIYIDPYKRS
jgi:hypothetical protein